MKFNEFKRKTSKNNILDAVDVLGSFDFYTLIASFDSLSKSDLESCKQLTGDSTPIAALMKKENIEPTDFSILKKVIPLLIHEYTHFVDTTSTYWGIKHLEKMNEAYLSETQWGGNEKTFFKAKNFHDHSRQIRLPRYYTVIEKSANNIKPWRSLFSLGMIFSSSGLPSTTPVIFARFYNYHQAHLVRSPLSTVSLLETTAMGQELQIHSKILARSESNFKIVESGEFLQSTLNYIYDHNITEYSACTHIIANQQNCADMLSAFSLSSMLARVVLNFTKAAFVKIARSTELPRILNAKARDSIVEKFKTGLERQNHGIAFYLLSQSLPKESYRTITDQQNGVQTALSRFSINDDWLRKNALDEIAKTQETLEKSPIKSIRHLATSGSLNFSRIDILDPALDFDNLNLPPVFLGDSEIYQLFGNNNNNLRDFDLEECFKELFSGQEWVTRFSESCV